MTPDFKKLYAEIDSSKTIIEDVKKEKIEITECDDIGDYTKDLKRMIENTLVANAEKEVKPIDDIEDPDTEQKQTKTGSLGLGNGLESAKKDVKKSLTEAQLARVMNEYFRTNQFHKDIFTVTENGNVEINVQGKNKAKQFKKHMKEKFNTKVKQISVEENAKRGFAIVSLSIPVR